MYFFQLLFFLSSILGCTKGISLECCDCEEECGYSVHFDLLYWKARENSLVLTNEKSPVFFTDDFTAAKVVHPHFRWNLGFRIGIGYQLPCSQWEAALDWTHYQTTVHQKRTTNSNDLTNVDNQEGMFPVWALSPDIISGDYVSDAFLHGKLRINLVDLDFVRPGYCANCLEIKPYVGVRGACIEQRASMRYEGGIFLTDIIEGGVSRNGRDHVHLKNDFWGIGPKIGIKSEISSCWGFGLYGDAAISGLLGEFSLSQRENYLGDERFSRHRHPVRWRWVGDLSGGISWKPCFCQNICQLTFKLGWEYHIFFHQLELKRDAFHLVPQNRNLAVQGVTFSSQIDF